MRLVHEVDLDCYFALVMVNLQWLVERCVGSGLGDLIL